MRNAMSSLIPQTAAAVLFLGIVLGCTTEKTVYVLPDGTEVTPTAAQATQAAGDGSQAAQATTASVGSAFQSEAESGESRPTQPAAAGNQRWNDRRNTLCSSLGLEAGLCGKIALNQT